MAKEKKGLSAIFGEGIENIMDEIDGVLDSKEPSTNIEIKNIISNPYQPRKQFDNSKLKELSESIKQHEVFTPIIVKKAPTGKYYLIAGERRTRASKIAGLKTIPAIILDITDIKMHEFSLIENIQRVNLNSMEEAYSFNKLINECKITQDELSSRIGKSRSYISNTIRLLKLPSKVQKYVLNNKLTNGHAKLLLSIIHNPELIEELAIKIIDDNWSVRKLEMAIASENDEKIKHKKKRSINFILESKITEKLGTKVLLREDKIVISFTNINDLNRILGILHLIN